MATVQSGPIALKDLDPIDPAALAVFDAAGIREIVIWGTVDRVEYETIDGTRKRWAPGSVRTIVDSDTERIEGD